MIANTERAIELRDAALKLMAARGRWSDRGPIRLLAARIGNLNIAHRTPFQKLPKLSDRDKLRLAVHSGNPGKPYSLDISYFSKKVLNIEWDDSGSFDVLFYKPGEWENVIV